MPNCIETSSTESLRTAFYNISSFLPDVLLLQCWIINNTIDRHKIKSMEDNRNENVIFQIKQNRRESGFNHYIQREDSPCIRYRREKNNIDGKSVKQEIKWLNITKKLET